MHYCPNCAAEMIPGAKFCHRCGDPFKEKTKTCPACQQQSPLASVFCHHCRFHFEGKSASKKTYQPYFQIDFEAEDLTEQVKALFFRSLRKRVEEEHDLEKYSHYVDRFYQSRFREVYAARSEQIATEVKTQWNRFGMEGLPEIDQKINHAFEGLLDFFTINFCPDLNGIILPSSILKYEHPPSGQTDLWPMVQDYLDFNREDEIFYFNFYTMEEGLLANACKQFLSAQRREKVFFICDLSIKGSCKEGFALTDEAIYWRAPFDKARAVRYKDIQNLKREKEWLTINGYFFTANPSLNLKLYKLLKKLNRWSALATSNERVGA